MTRRRCDPDRRGQGVVGDARITMQQAQDSAVHIIKLSGPNILRWVVEVLRLLRYSIGHMGTI